jgi:hypothetical protein
MAYRHTDHLARGETDVAVVIPRVYDVFAVNTPHGRQQW